MVVLPFALSLFDRAPAGERVTDRFRQTMSTRGLHELKGNFATVGALFEEFTHRTSPELARELHMGTAAFDTYVRDRFPGVASVADGMKMNGLDFAPLPWYIIGPGIALLLSAGLALLPRR